MTLQTSDFDYFLPDSCIAQTPANPRESAKLMVVNKKTGEIVHDTMANLPHYFSATDVVVLNNTKVFNARLKASVRKNEGTEKNIELFLVKPIYLNPNPPRINTEGTNHSQPLSSSSSQHSSVWLCIGKPGKVISEGSVLTIAPTFYGSVTKKNDDGTFEVLFEDSTDEVIKKANMYGSVPLPPYIKTIAKEEDYQTSYAKYEGSVAAPTAGFHMTPTIRTQMEKKGVTFVEITLHVGLGTFLPVKTENIEEHKMHSEWVEISEDAAKAINEAKQKGKRIVAIGTTTTRALEGVVFTCHSRAGGNLLTENYVTERNKGNTPPQTGFSNVTSSFNIPTMDPRLRGDDKVKGADDLKIISSYAGDVNIFITPGFEFLVIDGLLTNFHLPKSTLLMLVSSLMSSDEKSTGREKILKIYQEAVKNNYRFFSFGDGMLII